MLRFRKFSVKSIEASVVGRYTFFLVSPPSANYACYLELGPRKGRFLIIRCALFSDEGVHFPTDICGQQPKERPSLIDPRNSIRRGLYRTHMRLLAFRPGDG